jgi:hypothetical protein
MNLIKSGYAKAIIAGLGAGLTFLELSLTPHTWPYVLVGAILAVLTTVGVYLQPNSGTPAA